MRGLWTDNASGTDVDGQQAGGGYRGPTTATIEPPPLSPHHRASDSRLHHVTVAETPGGDRRDYRISDVTDNDVNNRLIQSLQVGLRLRCTVRQIVGPGNGSPMATNVVLVLVVIRFPIS